MRSAELVCAVALGSVLILAAACGDDDNGDGGRPAISTATAATTITPRPSPTPLPGRTGIPELDAFIDALIADHGEKETPALAALIGFTQIACTATPVEALGGPPPCQLNEEDGELVDVFPQGVCEGQLLRPHEIDRVLTILADTQLYAIYRPSAGGRYSGDYVAVVTDTAAEGTGLASAVEIDDGKIVGLSFSCAAGPEEFVQQFAPEDVVLPPEAE